MRHDTEVTTLRVLGFVALIVAFILGFAGAILFFFLKEYVLCAIVAVFLLFLIWLSSTKKTYLHEFVWHDD